MGLFEFAHKGTLFLDEIGEMPISLQSKLLRVLQERNFRPLGGREQIAIDVRVVGATNRDLELALQDKTFRSDLYYRLNVFTLRLPPLRERVPDIPLLAVHFLTRFARDNRLAIEKIAEPALRCLMGYHWPGNVRELQNVIEHAATMAAGSVIGLNDLPDFLRRLGAGDTARENRQNPLFTQKTEVMDQFERDYLVALLVEHRFNFSRAAQSAGCHRRTLYRMVHRHALDLKALRRHYKSKQPASAAGCG
jgi:transcriptional regulator with PAS, ATPase and Fis domain